ncbi:cobalamin biosynthesis protein CbiG [Shimia sp. SK013]|uniref:cobalamin biosynthesis protein n=1 Tax=Shimia sp. SK013 TaxID=1389006 RepID=UPI0006B65FA6|nr:cobalamin biosynthesis protein [Shimia sp. SK013]KPA21882.1 cobalamin biosynthesis protein CbiG [Shimia sp. SK013]
MIVAGFGFRATATVESLENALAATGVRKITAIAAPSDKAQNDALQELASALGMPVIEIATELMRSAQTITDSSKVREKRGTGSVAEACALVAAGDGATLTGPRVVSQDRLATCAIARGVHR